MAIKLSAIGTINVEDGRDEYVLMKRLDDELTAEEAEEYMLGRVYRDTDVPGGYFCKRVLISKTVGVDDECIAIIHHRYNV